MLVGYLFDRNTRGRAKCQARPRKGIVKHTSTALNSLVQTVATPLKNCAKCQSMIHPDTGSKGAAKTEGNRGRNEYE